MRIFALIVILLLGAGYVWSTARVAPQETSVREVRLSPEELARANTLFAGKCARCHGADGRGQTVVGKLLGVPDFTNTKWSKAHGNTDQLIESITNGNGNMPAFGKKLTRREISLLADHVRYFNKPGH